MFILMFVLTVLSIPRVWLKPSIAQSEFDILIEDEETKAKRQALFIDLIHQAIEKYANCANEHLAPLKDLAQYKQYETFVYPEGYKQPSTAPFVGNTNIQTRPKIKCNKVNLCSLQPQHSHSSSGINYNHPVFLGKPQQPISDVSQPSHPFYPYTKTDYSSMPIYGRKRFGFKPLLYDTRYYQHNNRNNLSSLPFSREFFYKLLYGSKPKDKLETVKTSTQSTTEPDSILGSGHTVTTFDGERATNFESVTEIDGATEKTTVLDTTSAEPILGSSLENSTPAVKTKKCSCLKNKKKNHYLHGQTTTSEVKPVTEPSNVVQSTSDSITSTSETRNCACQLPLETGDSKFNKKLNLLFLQLDIMAHNENKEDLKKILKKLKALQSSVPKMEETESTTDKMVEFITALPTTLTSTLSSSGEGSPLVAVQHPNISSKEINNINASKDTENLQTIKSTHFNEANIKQIHTNLNTNNTVLEHTSSLGSTAHAANKSQHKDTLLQASLNLESNSDTVSKVTSSSSLNLNIKNSKDVSRLTNEMHNLVSSKADATLQENSELKHSQDNEIMKAGIIGQIISSKNNKASSSSITNITSSHNDFQKLGLKDELKSWNQHLGNVKDNLVSHAPQHNKNSSLMNSTITISISSNGSFKKIEVEHQSSKHSDKNMEIHEKEKINMNSPKVRSIDMTGIDSRYLKFLKNSQQKDPYDEPILSEIYTIKPKPERKKPLSIYWHKIEKQPTKLRKNTDGIWKTFQSIDYDGMDAGNTGNKENMSILLKECKDIEDISESEGLESEEYNHKQLFKQLCKRSSGSFT